MAVFMRLSDDSKMINVTAPFDQKDEVKKINGRIWNPKIKRWQVPLDNFKEALAVFPDARVDEELTVTLVETEARNKTAIETKNLDSADVTIDGLKGTLYDYQAVGKEFLHLLKDGEGAVLAFDMGLGKSITALAEFLDLKKKGMATKALVVCPASLKYSTWKKEILKWTDLTYMVVEGDPFEDADREVEIEEEEEEWVRDEQGKRVAELVPVMGKAEYHNFGIDTRVFLGNAKGKSFEKLMKLCRNLIPDDWEVMDFDITESYAPQEWATKTGKSMGDWVWGIRVKKPTGEFKRKYLKRKTGRTLTKIVKMNGKELREIQYQQDVDVMIINYELFLWDMDIMPKINSDWVVILDECHRIKNPKNVTTKNLIKQCDPAGRKFLLSGTPLENNLEELWSIVNFARKGLLGTFYKFKERYLETDFWGTPIAPKNKPELVRKIAPIIMRRRKDEVKNKLPPLTEQVYWVEMTELQRKLYRTLSDGILETIDSQGEEETSYLSVLAMLTRLQQLLDSPALLREVMMDENLPLDSGKLSELESILEDINPKENKTIVFSQYKSMADILYDRLVQLYGIEHVRYIHGGVNNQLRGIYQNEFQESDDVRVMVLTTAGNYGLDLYKASYVILYDQLFNPQKMAQVIARAHRNGAVNPVTAIHLMTRDSYEERKAEILETKKVLFKEIIDGDAPEEDDEAMVKQNFTLAELKSLVGV